MKSTKPLTPSTSEPDLDALQAEAHRLKAASESKLAEIQEKMERIHAQRRPTLELMQQRVELKTVIECALRSRTEHEGHNQRFIERCVEAVNPDTILQIDAIAELEWRGFVAPRAIEVLNIALERLRQRLTALEADIRETAKRDNVEDILPDELR